MAADLSVARLVISATSPLSFSERKPGGIFQASLGYVPAGALRGAVATALLPDQHDMGDGHPENCAFCHHFVDKDTAVVFTNAYPVIPARLEEGPLLVKQTEGQPRVLPATAMSCKAYSGFLGSREAHGVFDTLLDRYCWETLAPAGVVYAPTCPLCHDRLDHFGGFYVQHTDHGETHRHSRRVSQRLLTRVAINRRRGVAEEGLLYSPWVMHEAVWPDDHRPNREEAVDEDLKPDCWQPTTFVGRVVGADQQVLAALAKIVAVGGGSSRGLNQVQVRVEADQAEGAEALEKRVADFNELLGEVWAGYRRLGSEGPQEPVGVFFSLTLQSDGVFCLPDGRPTMVPTKEMLRLESPIELVRSEAATYYGGGWNTAWGLPKPAEVRVHKGGVYLFRAVDGLTAADYQALARCQVQGIGSRRAEGFGQVRVCAEFHLKRRERR